MTREERRDFEGIIEKYQTVSSEEATDPKYFQKLFERHEEIIRQRNIRYIISFSRKKEEILKDVKEILDAVEKKDFEKSQDMRREVFLENDKDINDDVEKLLKKNFPELQ